MAIKNNTETQYGIKVEEAYLRVEFPSINKDSMSFNLRKYVNKSLPFFDEEFVTCPYNMDGKNPYVQAYEYLKTLDKFKDAEDA